MTDTANQDSSATSLEKDFQELNQKLGQLRERILLLTAEESQLLIERAKLEKELYPVEHTRKASAVMELLRHRRYSL